MTTMPSDERYTEWARFHDHRDASNPLSNGMLGGVPEAAWAAEIHQQGPTRILPLDSSAALGVAGPATTPASCANFVRVCPGEAIATQAEATSQLFFVMRGSGSTKLADGGQFAWDAGDLFTLPAGGPATHVAAGDAALYWVHDEPLLRYLGAAPDSRASNRPSTVGGLPSRRSMRWSAILLNHPPRFGIVRFATASSRC